MARQSDLMAESLLETRKAADAAKKSADDANLTMKLSHYAYLEMVDWKIMAEADYSVGVAGTVKWGKTRSLHIWCRIINAGNIPATINTIETNFGPRGITEGPNATVIPLSVGYAYRYTINFDSVPSVEFKGNTKFGGAIRGKIRYTHFFERRIRHFHQLFSFDQTTNECEIVPMEGAGNNDEPDQDSEQSAN